MMVLRFIVFCVTKCELEYDKIRINTYYLCIKGFAKKRKPDDPPESPIQSETVSDQHLTETSESLNSSIQINQIEILLSLTPAIQEEIQMELRMPNKTTVTKILSPNNKTYKVPSKEKRPLKIANKIVNL
ncbi:Hypothetical_protein [Hexamita inflata]|uniref:Hypothetical_protein n=1 Tax=Hexamita inflata TaxID=28002 RepID=A0AA86QKB5_9EUKA|nr:Hypothetical protein HINF_LOCUS45657 [Hexamita inflata]